MNKISRIIQLLFSEPSTFLDALVKKLLWWLPDDVYLKLRFRLKMGEWPNLKNPKTFNEKLQWLKLYNRKPEYTTMVDKYAVKEYVATRIGNEYIIPTIGVWDSVEDIEWDKLPDQFVLKTTHGGGGNGVFICKDKNVFDKKKAIKSLKESMKSDIYHSYREWPYKNVPRKIIAEVFMEQAASSEKKDLDDYKFFCFNGEPMYCQVIRDRHTKETIDFYDMDWNHQEFVGLNPIAHNNQTQVARNGLTPVARPSKYELMIDICRKLSKDIPFIRVDLYVINELIYFGELTFFPASGIGIFTPIEWTSKLGDLLTLPIEDA